MTDPSVTDPSVTDPPAIDQPAKEAVDVSAVVVTYNAPEWTRRSLSALAAHDGPQTLETVVLDNASAELDEPSLTAWAGPRATIVMSPENLGFGRGCNAAVQHASGRYVLLVNPDAIVEKGTVEALVDFHVNRPDVGIVGGRVLTPDGTPDRGSCWGSQTLWSLACFATGLSTALAGSAVFNPEGMGSWARDTAREVGVVTGCLLLIPRELWDRLEGFDPRFFMYGEDADLCARARRLGYSSWITPDAVVVHASGASSASRIDKQVLLFRGKATLARGSWTGPRRRLALTLLAAGVGLRAAVERATVRRSTDWRQLWQQRGQWLRGW